MRQHLAHGQTFSKMMVLGRTLGIGYLPYEDAHNDFPSAHVTPPRFLTRGSSLQSDPFVSPFQKGADEEVRLQNQKVF